MSSRKKILFYTGALHGGGAEHVLTQLLTTLDRSRFDPALILVQRGGVLDAEIPPDLRVLCREDDYRSITRVHRRFTGLIALLRREKPDLVVSFLTGPNLSLLRCRSFLPKKTKLMIREGNNPLHVRNMSASGWGIRTTEKRVKKLYPSADAMIASSEGVKKAFVREWDLNPERIEVIHNMIRDERISLSSPDYSYREEGKPLLIAAGRLTPQKGYPDMIRLFARVNEAIPSRLLILGVGPQESELRELIRAHRLEEAVHLGGYIDPPYPLMKAADLYLSTSHYEGFHLSVAEAMACGTLPLATDCDFGPGEIIDQGKNGFLFPVHDTESMAEQAIRLLRDPQGRAALEKAAQKKAEQFSSARITTRYEKLFLQVIGGER